ncbi:hypothetical protein CEXT_590771 [Caerostris extrusa]|uniref:Uncharacterized protein n=1 Tax=Caerostris extrusa TaxID=172846 RepID=A0AAV4Y7I3_CAEEX|nr:hypothetical protein CEXT_590771 [Caerostris extrusa]
MVCWGSASNLTLGGLVTEVESFEICVYLVAIRYIFLPTVAHRRDTVGLPETGGRTSSCTFLLVVGIIFLNAYLFGLHSLNFSPEEYEG